MVYEQCLNKVKITHGFSIAEGKKKRYTYDATLRPWICFLDLRSQARWVVLRSQENRQVPTPPVPKATIYLGFSRQFSLPTPTVCPVQGREKEPGLGEKGPAPCLGLPRSSVEVPSEATPQKHWIWFLRTYEPSVQRTGMAHDPKLPFGICRQSYRKLRVAVFWFCSTAWQSLDSLSPSMQPAGPKNLPGRLQQGPTVSISPPGLTGQGQISAWMWWQMPV